MTSTLQPSTVVRALRELCERAPDHELFRFESADGGAATLTAAELERRARAIALTLGELPAGSRAVLVHPPGLEFVCALLGCMLAGLVPVPVYPPDPARLRRALPRLIAVVTDADAAVVLTTAALAALGAGLGQAAPVLAERRWIATDTIDPAGASAWRDRGVAPAPAFIQYTSGSTSQPKGVVVSHGAVLANAAMIAACTGLDRESVMLSWLPLYHDMGLVGHVLVPIAVGCRSVLMAPMDFLGRPFRWLDSVGRNRATLTGGPNFAYELCTRRISDDELSSLDLSSLRVAFNGAEPVRGATLGRFADRFAPAGLRREALFPCYGLAEHTLLVSGGPHGSGATTLAVAAAPLEAGRIEPVEPDRLDARVLVGCGQPAPGVEVVVVDPDTRMRVAADQVGELWVRGGSVGDGYHGRPDTTAAIFRARVAVTGEGPFLRTGDLGFLHGGELYVSGRRKDLLIQRGRNLFPQDLELTAETAHPGLRSGCSAAFSLDIAGEERLVIVVEVARGSSVDPGELVEAVRRSVADEHDVGLHAVVLIAPGTIPKTSSGKIQRAACRQAYLEGELDQLHSAELSGPLSAPVAVDRAAVASLPPAEARQLVERFLQDRMSGLVHRAALDIDLDLPLDRLGLDSLTVAELVLSVEQQLEARVFMSDFQAGRTLRSIAAQLAESVRGGGA